MKLIAGVYAGKGATAYELQVWRIVIRATHLNGNYWKNKPWRRLSIEFCDKD